MFSERIASQGRHADVGILVVCQTYKMLHLGTNTFEIVNALSKRTRIRVGFFDRIRYHSIVDFPIGNAAFKKWTISFLVVHDDHIATDEEIDAQEDWPVSGSL